MPVGGEGTVGVVVRGPDCSNLKRGGEGISAVKTCVKGVGRKKNPKYI